MDKDHFIEVKDDNIDVQKIMEEIRARIKERGIEEVNFPDTLSLAKSLGDNLDEAASYDDIYNINTMWNVAADRPITSHRKFLGPIIVFGKKVVRKLLRWYINPFVDQQREFNAAATRVLNSFKASMDDYHDKLHELEQKLNELEGFKDQLYRAEVNIRALNEFAGSCKDIQAMQDIKLKRMERTLNDIRLQPGADPVAPAHPVQGAGSASTDSKGANHAGTSATDTGEGIDYFRFELKYRGSRESIKENQKRYLKYFEGKNNILDIGCGRGEFIELLLEQGKTGVRGVDLNEDMVAFCKSKNLPVEYMDAVAYMKSISPGELEGIYMGQVIEHLRYNDILSLIRLAYEKLAAGGMFIIETLNPMCLSIFSNAFYMDISHEKPIHPLTLEFIMESVGFSSVEKIFFSEIKEKIPALQGTGIQNIQEFNAAMERVNNLLFGMQDYAVIARK